MRTAAALRRELRIDWCFQWGSGSPDMPACASKPLKLADFVPR